MLPISFHSLYKERVWGGRALTTVCGRSLPEEDVPYGESWELCDRADDQTLVSAGEYEGLTLNQLWQSKREALFGKGYEALDRFPLLIKILDCQKDLSIQVHPPLAIAEKFGGEPKSEMWYIAEVDEGAKLYVGVKPGVDVGSFAKAIEEQDVEAHVNVLSAEPGQSIYLESGVLHAIGAGHLIIEIQQNSDTTYRVYDWNRLGLDGKPRALQVKESLLSIDFESSPPPLISAGESLRADNAFFEVTECRVSEKEGLKIQDPSKFAVLNIISGVLKDESGGEYSSYTSLLLPRGFDPLSLEGEAVCLITQVRGA